MPKPPPLTPLQQAIAKVGGAHALSRALGLHPTTVGKWPHVPAKHVSSVAKLTGISIFKLRPDLFE
jgi:DNA-binding transcriptional regulator YdaS (Cro superfamily)